MEELNEVIKPDILPVSGAGQWGTDEVVDKYVKDTPGQCKVKRFSEYKKEED